MEKELLINKIPLFDGLPADQIRDLAAITIDKRIPRNSTIFSEGAPATGFYVVISGRVKIYKISPDGKEQILHLFGEGEPFGEVPVFEGRRFPAHATALDDSRLLFFPRVDFIELIKSNPSLALNMLAVLSKRLRRFTVLVDDLSLKEVPARLAAHFIALSNQKGGATDVELEVPKSQLAGMLGTIPETFSRILGRMIKGGFIDSEGAKIRIKDREGLSEIAQGIRRL